jgi:hypothetical protein
MKRRGFLKLAGGLAALVSVPWKLPAAETPVIPEKSPWGLPVGRRIDLLNSDGEAIKSAHVSSDVFEVDGYQVFNRKQISFPEITSGAGYLTHVAICTSSGTTLFEFELDRATPCTAGMSHNFPVGSLVIDTEGEFEA